MSKFFLNEGKDKGLVYKQYYETTCGLKLAKIVDSVSRMQDDRTTDAHAKVDNINLMAAVAWSQYGL